MRPAVAIFFFSSGLAFAEAFGRVAVGMADPFYWFFLNFSTYTMVLASTAAAAALVPTVVEAIFPCRPLTNYPARKRGHPNGRVSCFCRVNSSTNYCVDAPLLLPLRDNTLHLFFGARFSFFCSGWFLQCKLVSGDAILRLAPPTSVQIPPRVLVLSRLWLVASTKAAIAAGGIFYPSFALHTSLACCVCWRRDYYTQSPPYYFSFVPYFQVVSRPSPLFSFLQRTSRSCLLILTWFFTSSRCPPPFPLVYSFVPR